MVLILEFPLPIYVIVSDEVIFPILRLIARGYSTDSLHNHRPLTSMDSTDKGL
jgi:hypothetical protein